MPNLTAKLEGKELVIRIPVNDPPEPSASGKSLVVVSTHGNIKTDVLVQGKRLTLGINGYISRNGE